MPTPSQLLERFEAMQGQDGTIATLSETGYPTLNCATIYFIWYRQDKQSQYKILLSSFNTLKEKCEERIRKMKNALIWKECKQIGLGEWDLKTGQLKLMKSS